MARKTARTARKPQGLSVHIGLNAVSAKHYEGWSGELTACEFDARDMAAIAKSSGLKPTVLLTKKATRKAVLDALGTECKTRGSANHLHLTYPGHEGQIPNVTGEKVDK